MYPNIFLNRMEGEKCFSLFRVYILGPVVPPPWTTPEFDAGPMRPLGGLGPPL